MRLREGLAAWRRLGVRRGTAAAAAVLTAPVRSRWRAARLRLRPLRVSRRQLTKALGGADPARLLRGVVLEAMPTVRAFAGRLSRDEQLRTELLEAAEQIAAHRFDLLGSGPTELGAEIDWHRDFKAGRSWPRVHISRIVISYADASDIKVPWELSRCQHLPVLAAAYLITQERRWIEEIGAELEHWIETNPVEFGPNWACTMDVAIRAVNWLATLALLAEAAPAERWFEPVLGSLLLHGRFIRSHLEWAPVRGNHYLSDVVGLLIVASLFSQGAEGRAWAAFAGRELESELAHQVRADGCDHEASIPYHRLVTELFVTGTQAARALAPGTVGPERATRIASMLAFTCDYTRPDGLAPQVGDADDGRLLPLGDYGRADPGSHLHLFDQAAVAYTPATNHAAYPESGYWIMRAGDLYVLIRCGDVGVGSHAHNDALSFELACGAQPLIVDPGSYLYTADPVARDQFRSTGFHASLQVDGAEQNPIAPATLFAMEDRRRAQATGWELADPLRPAFEGEHHGFEQLAEPALHRRRLELDVESRSLLITDTVSSAGEHRLDWTFPLSPCRARAGGSSASARYDSGVTLDFDAPGLEFRVEDGWLSPSYGRRIPAPFLRVSKRSRPPDDVTQIRLSIRS